MERPNWRSQDFFVLTRAMGIDGVEKFHRIFHRRFFSRSSSLDKRTSSFKAPEKKIQLARLWEKASFSAENTRVLDFIRKPELWQLFPTGQPLDQFLEFVLWNSWRIWNRSCDSINCKSWKHNLRCDNQRSRAFCEWNSWSQTRAQVQ